MGCEFLDEQGEKAARTYSAAADHYSGPALGFWDRFGPATVDRKRLPPGKAVMDLRSVGDPSGSSLCPGGRAVCIDVEQ